MADKTPMFAIKPDDPKDVSWGLTTAEACFRRGERSDALRWLRRAVEAASEAEADERALELAKLAADLATQIGTMAPPPPVPRGAQNVQVMTAIPKAAAVPSVPTAARPTGAVAPRPPIAKEPPKKERKSITNEAAPRSRAGALVGRAHDKPAEKAEKAVDRPAEKASEKSSWRAQAKPEPAPVEAAPAPRKRSNSRAGEVVHRTPSRTDEIDQWPTELGAGGGGRLAPRVDDEPTSQITTEAIMAASAASAASRSPEILPAQAVRVIVWREPGGAVSVRPAGGAAPAGAIEATLVASDATADLVALLRE